jgi:hypothetical protein
LRLGRSGTSPEPASWKARSIVESAIQSGVRGQRLLSPRKPLPLRRTEAGQRTSCRCAGHARLRS